MGLPIFKARHKFREWRWVQIIFEEWTEITVPPVFSLIILEEWTS